MKEIIKKIVIAVLVAVIAIGVAVKFIKGDEPAVDATTSSAAADSGNESESSASKDNVNKNEDANSKDNANKNENAVSGDNANKNENAASNNATNNDGGSVQQNSPSSDNGSSGQSTQNNGQSSSQGSAVQTPSTDGNGNAVELAPQDSQNSQSNNGSTQQGAQTDVQQNTQAAPQGNQNTQSNNGSTQQNANKIDVYQQIFASGRFVMKINDPDLGPVTMGMSGNKMFIDASMEGVTLKMLYDGDKPAKDNPDMGTWYIVVDQIKKYSPMPADMVGDMNVDELTKDFAKDSNNVYTKSTETIGNETYDCESHVDENGNTTKYYFKGDVLVRSDSISPSGEVSTTEFQEISGNVDDSLFEIPEGYAKFDISWLLGMIG